MRLYVIDISSPFCSGIMTVEDISYLIASYIVVSDGEISNIELDYLARNFSPSEVGKVEVYLGKHLLFSEKIYTMDKVSSRLLSDKVKDILDNWNA